MRGFSLLNCQSRQTCQLFNQSDVKIRNFVYTCFCALGTGLGLDKFCASRISSRKSHFWGEHSAGRIRHFEQNSGRSVTLLICMTVLMWLLARTNTPFLKKKFTVSTYMHHKWHTNFNKAMHNEYLVSIIASESLRTKYYRFGKTENFAGTEKN